MDSREQTAVRKIWTNLINDLDPKHSVLDYLFEKGEDSGILLEQYELIMCKPTRLDRAHALLLQVFQTCPIATFIRALEYGDAHLHLAEMIRRSLKATADQNASESASSCIEVPKATSERKPLREKQVSQNPRTPRLPISDVQWDIFKENLLETVTDAIASSGKMPTGLKRRYVEDDEDNSTHLPMTPGKIPTKCFNSGDGHGFYRYMRRILHGQWTFDKNEGDMILMKLSFDPIVGKNADVRFMASFFNVHFKMGSSVLRGLDGMKEYFSLTTNPALFLMMYLTVKGRVALDEGRLDEAKGILESAEANVQLLEPSLETLYFLRVFSILKQKYLYLGDGGVSEKDYILVLARAGDVADRFRFSDENKGLLSVVYWHCARAYLHYHPDQDPPFAEVVDKGEIGRELASASKPAISDTQLDFAAPSNLANLQVDQGLDNFAFTELPQLGQGCTDPSMNERHSDLSKPVEGNLEQGRCGGGGGSDGSGGGGSAFTSSATSASITAAVAASSQALQQVEEGLRALGQDADQKGSHCLSKAAIAYHQGNKAAARKWLRQVRKAGYSSNRTIARARRLENHLEARQPPKPPIKHKRE